MKICFHLIEFHQKLTKKKHKISNTGHEPNKSQMSSNDPIVNSLNETVEPIKPVESKNKLKGGGNNEINHEFLNEILHNNNLKMELAMQIITNDQTVRSNTVQELKNFNCQSLTAQAEKGEQSVSMMPAIKKAFDLMGDDIVEQSKENETLKT